MSAKQQKQLQTMEKKNKFISNVIMVVKLGVCKVFKKEDTMVG